MTERGVVIIPCGDQIKAAWEGVAREGSDTEEENPAKAGEKVIGKDSQVFTSHGEEEEYMCVCVCLCMHTDSVPGV